MSFLSPYPEQQLVSKATERVFKAFQKMEATKKAPISSACLIFSSCIENSADY
jgi:hypothetical protein